MMADKIYTQEDGERREVTGEEAAQIQQDIIEMQLLEEALKSEREEKAASRVSALAKLAALGLTEDEIGAL
jgi:hypothetical protein